MLSAPEQPSRASHELVVLGYLAVVTDDLDQTVLAGIARALVDAVERQAFFVSGLLHIDQQVLDRGVTRRGQPNAKACSQRGRDHPRAAKGLARAGRSLDREDRLIEPE